MKFISSLICGMVLSIMLMLILCFAIKCDHDNIIEKYSFEPEKSTAMDYVKSVCAECGQGFGSTLFRDTPPTEKYADVIAEHCEDKTFVKGEYDTVKATVTILDYDAQKTKINCGVLRDDVEVYFSVIFKEGYEEAVSLLQKGDEITFYGKSALEGLSWTDCELITE